MARKVDSYGGQMLSCESVLSHLAVMLCQAALSSPVISHPLMECPHYNAESKTFHLQCTRHNKLGGDHYGISSVLEFFDSRLIARHTYRMKSLDLVVIWVVSFWMPVTYPFIAWHCLSVLTSQVFITYFQKFTANLTVHLTT